ncbi:MAG: hypothetical protein K0R96_18 [Pantoea agglomerans]|jgi:hypothetical protein|nr:hypothetical protein [Pantoea agglomerans]
MNSRFVCLHAPCSGEQHLKVMVLHHLNQLNTPLLND